MSILGAILRNGSLAHKVAKIRLESDFYFPKNRKILKSIIDCFSRGEKVDYITVSEDLKTKKELDYVGGIGYLKELISNAPDDINFDGWVTVVTSKSDLRKLINVSKKVTKSAYGEFDDAKGISEELGQEIHNIKRKHSKESFTRVFDTAEAVVDEAKNSKVGMSGIPTGFKDIDEITSGLQKTDLFILAGRPSMGKTALCVNIAYNAAKAGYKVLVFSLEMSKRQLSQRIIASEARVGLQNLRDSNLDVNAWARIANVLPELESLNLFVDDTPGISINEYRSKVFEFTEEHGTPDLVVLDYLQLMSGSGRENRQQEVSQISRELKGSAKEGEYPLVALSQLSRAPEGRADNRPRMSDLRESGSLEQDADVVAFVYRDEYYNKTEVNEGMVELIFSKQRNGPTGTIDLGFIGRFTRFENLIEV